jgi:hypothetical protein
VGDVDYMISRQGRRGISGAGDQSIILGGAKSVFLDKHEQWYDNINDDEEMPGVRRYFEGAMKRMFVGWDGNEHGNVDRVWTGGECEGQRRFEMRLTRSAGVLERLYAICRATSRPPGRVRLRGLHGTW